MTSPPVAASGVDTVGGPSTGWAPPPDAAPERTAVAVGRWQRRRMVRALLGRPSSEIGPRDGIGGAVSCGILLGVVLRVVALTVGVLT